MAFSDRHKAFAPDHKLLRQTIQEKQVVLCQVRIHLRQLTTKPSDDGFGCMLNFAGVMLKIAVCHLSFVSKEGKRLTNLNPLRPCSQGRAVDRLISSSE
jgi:hypothetical protein